MKNYIVDKKGEEKFIREVKKCSNGTLTLKFADGKVFKNVTACDENINKIIETQEAQAKEGMMNYKTFVKQVNEGKFVQHTIDTILANKNIRPLFCESVFTAGVMLLLIDNFQNIIFLIVLIIL